MKQARGGHIETSRGLIRLFEGPFKARTFEGLRLSKFGPKSSSHIAGLCINIQGIEQARGGHTEISRSLLILYSKAFIGTIDGLRLSTFWPRSSSYIARIHINIQVVKQARGGHTEISRGLIRLFESPFKAITRTFFEGLGLSMFGPWRSSYFARLHINIHVMQQARDGHTETSRVVIRL